MTNDKFPGSNRLYLYLFVICHHLSSVICHFESGAALAALELRALSGTGPRLLLQRTGTYSTRGITLTFSQYPKPEACEYASNREYDRRIAKP